MALLVLAVVSIPRFTGSQIRSKIALAFQRMNSINQANYSYNLDHNTIATESSQWFKLTTPTIYLQDWSNTVDPFSYDIIHTGQINTDKFFWEMLLIHDPQSNLTAIISIIMV